MEGGAELASTERGRARPRSRREDKRKARVQSDLTETFPVLVLSDEKKPKGKNARVENRAHFSPKRPLWGMNTHDSGMTSQGPLW